VVVVTDQDQRVAIPSKTNGFDVNLGYQRTRRVNNPKSPPLTGLTHLRSHAVSGVNDTFTLGDLIDAIHKDRTLGDQFFDHVAVVNDFLPDVDGRAEGLQCDTNDIYGTDHTGTEASRFEEEEGLRFGL
jgi:hypothetical protein